ncbi:putative bifunctional diguanylate cyclase/phosphodiesterase [Ovoidimarina sediminis]|uniref:putative bifunctional diguanylate cyclase/phosphodiesterase n=1 Tax=Ovoidimarina sediminis TaxID=3079856 RepID=UPI00290F7367|nr:bifunctional diguanylate cyclase/phosphodiesterase [Rhodophyticola sp. MJ-SS7]MDU8946321.1 bifunctional diguanylate cyclase/phosphodiesterase [Rhodophyticola sp. MJ-SS7]
MTLAAFWLGGEAALIAIAILMPAAFAMAGLYIRRARLDGLQRDPVSELPFRPEIIARTDDLLADGPTQSGMMASLALAIDEFSDLELQFGHTAASDILHTVAGRLRSVIRSSDLLGRLDGPRFIVVLTAATRADLESLIQMSVRLQHAVQEPIALDGTRIYVTSSIGFCTPKRRPGQSGAMLIEAAEQALDDAVSHGNGAIRAFSPDIQKRARSRGALSDQLPNALENDQIKPWFQPQISATTGEITGFEVLARWEHPESGLVPPSEFLTAAEELGLLERLGEVMLYKSLNALRAWDAEDILVPKISLNFSAEELRNPSIVDKIRWELDRFDIPPMRVSVEVLETVIAQSSSDTIIRNLRLLADLGFMIDLDDFGTGHASIANIKRFSVGRIKIDRSFVTQIDTDMEQQNIVSAILILAKRLELQTLAEGVETPAEHAILRQLGCDHLQGYGIARPMPFEQVAPWVKEHTAALLHRARSENQVESSHPAESLPLTGKTA